MVDCFVDVDEKIQFELNFLISRRHNASCDASKYMMDDWFIQKIE
jgi:hypothetical protein